MDNPIIISLVVSGIGMLMLFLSLALLCGLMYLMTAFIKDQPTHQPTHQLQRVAAIAVALARAEQGQSPVDATEAKETTSAWRALHHQRQLTHGAPTRRAR